MIKKISARNLYTGESHLFNKIVGFVDDKIVSIEDTSGPFDFENLAPAFIDIHLNGGYEYYFTSSVDHVALSDIEKASKETGAYYCLPALITSAPTQIIKGLQICADYKSKKESSGILGLHLEGPFISYEKRGAHPPEYVRNPSDEELKNIVKAGKDVIKIWTLAPELFQEDQIKFLLNEGINISIGHSNASFEQANHAFDLGVKLTTHLYNAMSGLNHRDPGLALAALLKENVYNPIILDGHHLSLDMARLAYKVNPSSILLITDALFLGRKKTSFQWENFDAQLVDGAYINHKNTLAGAAISLPEAMATAQNIFGSTTSEIVSMVTSRPAKAIGMYEEISRIEVGFPAIFTAFEEGFQSAHVIV